MLQALLLIRFFSVSWCGAINDNNCRLFFFFSSHIKQQQLQTHFPVLSEEDEEGSGSLVRRLRRPRQ